MKVSSFKHKHFFILFCAIAVAGIWEAFPYCAQYKEQFYKLFHTHYQQAPDDILENIYWLEKAAKADFCNPQFALAKIDEKSEWEKYRCLFMMHINLKLAEQHARLARIYDKSGAKFYDLPWKAEYLRDFEKAESYYSAGFSYWDEAKLWAEKASQKKFSFMTLAEIQEWEDEREMIRTGELDFEKTLSRALLQLRQTRSDMQNLKEGDY